MQSQKMEVAPHYYLSKLTAIAFESDRDETVILETGDLSLKEIDIHRHLIFDALPDIRDTESGMSDYGDFSGFTIHNFVFLLNGFIVTDDLVPENHWIRNHALQYEQAIFSVDTTNAGPQFRFKIDGEAFDIVFCESYQMTAKNLYRNLENEAITLTTGDVNDVAISHEGIIYFPAKAHNYSDLARQIYACGLSYGNGFIPDHDKVQKIVDEIKKIAANHTASVT